MRTQYVYIKSETALWTVGFYDPSGQWHPESDWPSKEAASIRVHYLNGDCICNKYEEYNMQPSNWLG